MKQSLKSSVETKGETVTQITTYKDGCKKTHKGVITKTIVQSEFTRFDVVSGYTVYINKNNVNEFEIHPE